MKNYLPPLLILILALFGTMGIATSAPGETPNRGNYVPADLGTQIHPFVEHIKFSNQFASATLLESNQDGWTIRFEDNGKMKEINIPIYNISLPLQSLETGNQVIVKWNPNNPNPNFLIIDHDRKWRYLIAIMFGLTLCALVGGWITIRSMSGVIIGLCFFFFWSLPAIQSGSSILLQIGLFYVLVTLLVLPASLGWNQKALSAILTAMSTGIISIVILKFCADWIGIVGLRNENLRVIEYATRYFPNRVAPLTLSNLVIAATLIGSLGVILDVSVDVTSSAAEIANARPELPLTELLQRTMTVSSRLVGTMTNTLLLAYVGTDLFLILTIYILPTPRWIMLNEDFIAMEVLRGLGGALGFLAAVPLAVLFYSMFQSDSAPDKPENVS